MQTDSTQHPQQRAHTRSIARIITGRETSDGAGVRLRRYIASPELEMLDPFLLLDVFSSDNPDDYIAGFPPHPHRGFETVTYLIEGTMRHRDSTGHEGVIRAGGVQWMTAGSGIEHSEMPQQEDGLLYGFQLWVNLPAKKKMTAPRYQEFDAQAIPVEQRGDGMELRVIAGTTSRGTRGPVQDIEAAPLYLDIRLAQGRVFTEGLEPGHNAFIYVMTGAISTGATEHERVTAASLAVLTPGERVRIEAQEDSRLLLVSGKPFAEPVARHGPFVMNTQQELEQAHADYRAGSFGRINR